MTIRGIFASRPTSYRIAAEHGHGLRVVPAVIVGRSEFSIADVPKMRIEEYSSVRIRLGALYKTIAELRLVDRRCAPLYVRY